MARWEACPNCGTWMKKIDEDTWYCPVCGADDDDDIPEGCAACGGDYPNCVDSCPMFDD